MQRDESPDDINERTTRFVEPRNFLDPDDLSAEELSEAGLPPRPDPEQAPELYAFWKQLLRPPLRYVSPYFTRYDPSENFLRSGGVSTRTSQQASRNWSGVSITPRDGRMFTDVAGGWRVPSVWAPADGEYRSSTWIGLDGQRSYLDGTLPQVGTAQQVKRTGGTSVVKTACWVQWWPGIDEHTINDLIFGVDDEVGAYLQVLPPASPGAPERVRLFITNMSVVDTSMEHPYSAWEWAVPMVGYPDPKQPPTLQPKVAGGTAEWVMECPTKEGSEELWPFVNFHPVTFTDCHAKTAIAPGAPAVSERITGPKMIRMYTLDKVTGRPTVASAPVRIGEYAFQTIPPPIPPPPTY